MSVGIGNRAETSVTPPTMSLRVDHAQLIHEAGYQIAHKIVFQRPLSVTVHGVERVSHQDTRQLTNDLLARLLDRTGLENHGIMAATQGRMLQDHQRRPKQCHLRRQLLPSIRIAHAFISLTKHHQQETIALPAILAGLVPSAVQGPIHPFVETIATTVRPIAMIDHTLLITEASALIQMTAERAVAEAKSSSVMTIDQDRTPDKNPLPLSRTHHVRDAVTEHHPENHSMVGSTARTRRLVLEVMRVQHLQIALRSERHQGQQRHHQLPVPIVPVIAQLPAAHHQTEPHAFRPALELALRRLQALL